MEELKKYLKTMGLQDKDWMLLEQTVDIKTLKKGDLLIEQYRPSRNSGFVLEGLMRYFCYDEDGNDPTGFFCEEHTFVVDPYSFFEQKAATLSLEAVTECKVAVISHGKYLLLCQQSSNWETMIQKLLLKTAMDFANQKDLMNMTAAKRYAFFLEKYPSFAQRAPLKYVASFLGIAQPSLSRIRKMPK
jgi:CRP-like cAMP-binding protein